MSPVELKEQVEKYHREHGCWRYTKKTCQNLLAQLRGVLEQELTEKISREQEDNFKKIYEEKLTAQTDRYEEELQKKEETIAEMRRRMEAAGLSDTDTKSDSVMFPICITDDKVPPILENGSLVFLQSIAKNLDPEAFFKFIQAAKKLYTWAMDGALQVPLQLDLLTFKHHESLYLGEPEEILVYCHDDKPLSAEQLSMMAEKRCFNPKLRYLSLNDKVTNGGKKMKKMLDQIGVKEIFMAEIETEFDIDHFVKHFKVRELRLHKIRDASFLKASELRRIPKVSIIFDRNFDVRGDVYDYFLNCDQPHIAISGAPMPVGLVFHLVQAWLNREEKFNDVFFQINGEIFSEMRKMLNLKFMEINVGEGDRLSFKEIKNIVSPLEPRIIIQKIEWPIHVRHLINTDNGTIIVIREDLKVLKIRIEDQQFVSLRKLYEGQDDEL